MLAMESVKLNSRMPWNMEQTNAITSLHSRGTSNISIRMILGRIMLKIPLGIATHDCTKFIAPGSEVIIFSPVPSFTHTDHQINSPNHDSD